MNVENLGSIGRIDPPLIDHDYVGPLNSFAINQFGDVAVISSDGSVKLCTGARGSHGGVNLRNTSGGAQHLIQDLSVDHDYLLKSKKFTNIEFNEEGTILLLWSKKVRNTVDVIESQL